MQERFGCNPDFPCWKTTFSHGTPFLVRFAKKCQYFFLGIFWESCDRRTSNSAALRRVDASENSFFERSVEKDGWQLVVAGYQAGNSRNCFSSGRINARGSRARGAGVGWGRGVEVVRGVVVGVTVAVGVGVALTIVPTSRNSWSGPILNWEVAVLRPQVRNRPQSRRRILPSCPGVQYHQPVVPEPLTARREISRACTDTQ